MTTVPTQTILYPIDVRTLVPSKCKYPLLISHISYNGVTTTSGTKARMCPPISGVLYNIKSKIASDNKDRFELKTIMDVFYPDKDDGEYIANVQVIAKLSKKGPFITLLQRDMDIFNANEHHKFTEDLVAKYPWIKLFKVTFTEYVPDAACAIIRKWMDHICEQTAGDIIPGLLYPIDCTDTSVEPRTFSNLMHGTYLPVTDGNKDFVAEHTEPLIEKSDALLDIIDMVKRRLNDDIQVTAKSITINNCPDILIRSEDVTVDNPLNNRNDEE